MGVLAVRRHVHIVVAGVAAVGLAAGCGSSSSKSLQGGTSSNAALSETEFVSRASAACSTANGQVSGLTQPTENSAIASYAGRVLSIEQGLRANLVSLVPPASKQAAYTKYLGLADEQIAKTTEFQRAAQANEIQRVESIGKEVQSLGGQAHALASELGLAECAKRVGGTQTGTGETGTSTGETP